MFDVGFSDLAEVETSRDHALSRPEYNWWFHYSARFGKDDIPSRIAKL